MMNLEGHDISKSKGEVKEKTMKQYVKEHYKTVRAALSPAAKKCEYRILNALLSKHLRKRKMNGIRITFIPRFNICRMKKC